MLYGLFVELYARCRIKDFHVLTLDNVSENDSFSHSVFIWLHDMTCLFLGPLCRTCDFACLIFDVWLCVCVCGFSRGREDYIIFICNTYVMAKPIYIYIYQPCLVEKFSRSIIFLGQFLSVCNRPVYEFGLDMCAGPSRWVRRRLNSINSKFKS